MPTSSGQNAAHDSNSLSKKLVVAPVFATLSNAPSTLSDLFRSVAIAVRASVNQPDPEGKKRARKQDYALPWAGYTSWRDARTRLQQFEEKFKARVAWVPFNGTEANDGPMSLNAYPGRAFIERVTNEGDANLEARAIANSGSMPMSPSDAAAKWFGLGTGALVTGLSDDTVLKLAQKTVTVIGFVGDHKAHKDSILDARDYGIGLTAAEMPGTILSLNRGNKKSKLWLTGKHGQGASSTFQYSDLTLIASRKIGAKDVAFTFVEQVWDDPEAKTPTFKYLTVDGRVPEVEISEQDFPAGTLVRHIGYSATDLFSLLGETSLYGLLMRSLAEPIFPVWLEMFSLRPGNSQGYPTCAGFRRYGRLIRGSVNALERAWQNTLKSLPQKAEDQSERPEEEDRLEENTTKILHRASEYVQLPKWDYGSRVGIGDLGRVKITYWVIDPVGASAQNVLRSWVDPNKTILMTLDGQTHAEESRALITGQNGAKLWAVGRSMVVQIDCNGLDRKARYELFPSTREHAKESPLKKMILEELVRRLAFDTKLQELNVQLAAADVKQSANNEATIASLIKKYLKAAGINFEQLTRKVEKWTTAEERREIAVSGRQRELPPIEAVEPPTFVRWRFAGESINLYPGQRYSFVFETDAAPSYWNPEDQTTSKIKVLGHGVSYLGAGDMKGGRVRCHFECPKDTAIGTKGYIQAQLEFAVGAEKTHRLPVNVVAKPTVAKQKKKKYSGAGVTPDDEGKLTKEIKVKVRKKDFTEVEIPVVRPIPVTRQDSAWKSLGWPHDPSRVGFSIRQVTGKIFLYYNAEFPPFLDLKHRMSKKSLEEEFIRRYEMKLVLHTIFTLNYDFVDEEDFTEDQKKQVRNLLCATAESLALATKSELEIESRLKSEDSTPLETAVAANLQEGTLIGLESGGATGSDAVLAQAK